MVALSSLGGGGGVAIPETNGPASNGYLDRKMWLQSGAYSFTAPASGWYKFDAVGAGESGSNQNASVNSNRSGAAGGRSIKEHYLLAGDVVSVTVGVGGVHANTNHVAGGSTTVVCAARSLSMTATGGNNAGGSGSGGDVNLTGGARATQLDMGGASAPSHLKNGYSGATEDAAGRPYGLGGSGLGGPAPSVGGSGSFSTGPRNEDVTPGGSGLTARGGVNTDASTTYPVATIIHGESMPFWDLNQVDGGGGAGTRTGSGTAAGNGGTGSGGGGASATSTSCGNGGILGGGGGTRQGNSWGGNGGNGGGGGCSSDRRAGNGGNGCVFIFWKELIERAAP